jgi:hypothetical protein
MTTGEPTIETAAAGARTPARGWPTLAWFAVALGAVYLLGLNRNPLYLSLLFALAVLLVPCMTRGWVVLAGLVLWAYLAVAPVAVPDLGKLYPAPRDIPGADRIWCVPIPPGVAWTYRFKLDGLERFPGAVGRLYVDGRGLSGLAVGIGGRTFKAAAFISAKEGMDHVAIPLEPGPNGIVLVSLQATVGQVPRLFRGTEVHGYNVYGDAVWLEFSRKRDRIIFESKRTATALDPVPSHHDP